MSAAPEVRYQIALFWEDEDNAVDRMATLLDTPDRDEAVAVWWSFDCNANPPDESYFGWLGNNLRIEFYAVVAGAEINLTHSADTAAENRIAAEQRPPRRRQPEPASVPGDVGYEIRFRWRILAEDDWNTSTILATGDRDFALAIWHGFDCNGDSLLDLGDNLQLDLVAIVGGREVDMTLGRGDAYRWTVRGQSRREEESRRDFGRPALETMSTEEKAAFDARQERAQDAAERAAPVVDKLVAAVEQFRAAVAERVAG